MLKKACWVTLAMLIPLTSFAAEKKEQGSGPNPYSECGVGAAIFQETAWAAATSNVIWDLGLTAITSALSSPETCNAKKVKTARLILETLPQLERDLASGKGEYLTALNETMDCRSDIYAELNSGFRTSYADAVRGVDYSAMTKTERATMMYSSVKTVVQKIPHGCSVVL